MLKLFSIVIILCGLMVLCIWFAAEEKVLSYDTHADSDAIVVTLHVRSLLPPEEKTTFIKHELEGLDTAHRAPVRLERLSWRGPVWKQTCFLPHTTLNAIPPQPVMMHGRLIQLPEIIECDTEQAQKPQPLHAPAENATPHFSPALLAFLALITLTFLFVRKLISLRSVAFHLRQLPPSPQSLERIPELLSRKGITTKTHPAFFQELDILRFAPSPPSQTAVRGIIKKAMTL